MSRSKRASPAGGGRATEIVLTGSECRRRREALSLTVYELSRRAGLEEQTVWRFEAAQVRPRQVTVVALHNALRRLEASGDLAAAAAGASPSR